MTDLQEIAAVWKGETSRATRSGRVLALLILFVMFVSLALAIVGFLTRQFNASIDEQLQTAGVDATDQRVKEQLDSGKKKFLAVAISDDEELLDSLLLLPVVLLFVFKLTLRFVPLFVTLMGFDQIAGEVGPKSIRFLVVRLKRNNLIFGKFLSQVTVFGVLLSVCTLLMVLVSKALTPDFAMKDVVLWTLRLLLASFVLALAYLALTTLCSALVRSGAVSLLVNLMLLFGIWSIALFGEAFRLPGERLEPGSLQAVLTSESPFAYARYLSVWHYGQDLLHPDVGRFATAVVMHVGFALLFLGLTQLVIKKRDL